MSKLVRAALVGALAVTGLTGVSQAQAEHETADVHTLETPPLEPGQIELLTVSTFPDAVTGGDVLVEVRGLADGDELELNVNGAPVPVDGGPTILVEGLVEGDNTLAAVVDGPAGQRVAELEVVNHPITGPVISGPHQQPFRCRTTDLGLGEPLDEHCSAPTVYQWFSFSEDDLSWHELDDPSGPYPDDVATTELRSEDAELNGTAVPFVARVETAIINRGVARIAVLDDPAGRDDPTDFAPNWNGRVYHSFGESCGVGYDQGRNSVFHVLGGVPNPNDVGADNLFANLVGLLTRVGEGDVVVHSTLTSFGNHCNPFVSMETAMMLKEHITERYPQRGGLQPIRTYVGTGSSGGALQQYNAVNNAPGLLDAAMPGASFADIATTAMTVTDCGLLDRYFDASDLDWSDLQRAAVTGHNPQTGTSINSICASWVDTFLDRIDPAGGSCGGLNSEQRYHPETNPTGSRCTVQDANVNWLGTDPATGFAHRPLDNVGVQYGLRAFNDGLISFEQFADLNRHIGGFDIDANHQPERHAMDPEAAAMVYRVGQVIGRGALAETPIIDFAPYLDLVPIANIHESARPPIIRERVRQAGGDGSTMSIWRGVVVQSDGFEEIDAWVAALNAAPSGGDRIADVAAAQPLTAVDQCAVGTVGGRVEAPSGARAPVGIPVTVAPGTPGPEVRAHMRAFVPEDHELGVGPCSASMPPVTTTRIAAGGPASDDVIKCQLKPVDPADYARVLSSDELAALADIFPDGVCDWTKPAVGDVDASILWPSLGSDGSGEPVGLVWRTARSG
jgi:hypothetical protein